MKEVRNGTRNKYPSAIDTKGKQALYDNLDRDGELALKVHEAVKGSAKYGFRDLSGGGIKMKAVRKAVKKVLPDSISPEKFSEIMDVIIFQTEY